MAEIEVIGPNGQTGTVPDGTDLSGYPGWRVAAPAASTRPNVPVNAATAQPNYNRTILPGLARAGTNSLPAIGAMGGMALGGLAGPPGAMLGAFAGGKLGEWARYGLGPQVGLYPPMPGLATMSDAANATLAGIGLGGGALGEAAAPGMMRTGLKMPPTWRQQWLATVAGGELPERAALRMKIATPEAAQIATKATGRAVGTAIRSAERRGSTINADALARDAVANAARELKRPLTASEHAEFLSRYAKYADELLNEAAGTKVRDLKGAASETVPFTPSQAQTVKRMAHKASKPEILRETQGASSIGQSEARLLGKSARRALARLPKVAAATLENQKARELLKALSRADARQQTSLPQHWAGTMGGALGAGIGAGVHGPIGAGVGATMLGGVGHVVASPEAQRQLALALMNPAIRRLIELGPLGLSIPGRMMMAPAPPDTLQPNPAWGGSTP